AWLEVHRTGPDVTRLSDHDVEPGHDYAYRVWTNDGTDTPGGSGGSGAPSGGGGSSSYSSTTADYDPANAPLPKMHGAAAVNEGAPYTLALSAANHAVRRWNIDWGDGGKQVVAGTATSVQHTYAQDSGSGAYQVKVFAEDENGRYDAVVADGSGAVADYQDRKGGGQG